MSTSPPLENNKEVFDVSSLISEKTGKMEEMFHAFKKQIQCAGAAITNSERKEVHSINAALYHFSVCMKIALKMVCLRFAIRYSSNDSLETLLDKAGSLLPSHIFELASNMCYWHYDVRNENKSIMTEDEACAIGFTFETYFNDFILEYTCEMKRSTKGFSRNWTNVQPLELF